MDEGFEDLGILREILIRHKDHIQLCCGHLHCHVSTRWNGISVKVASPICMPMELDFSEKGGDRFFLGNPGYNFYHLYQNIINTHACIIPTDIKHEDPYPFKYLDVDLKDK